MSALTNPQWKDAQIFRSTFTFKGEVAAGVDGTVSHWKKRTTGHSVAVKTANSGRSTILQKEIAVLKKVPPYEHIVSLLTHFQEWQPVGPALVFELAEYGDMISYRKALRMQEGGDGVPEMTLWKFLRDMSLGLDWLHNRIGEPHVHGDLKPDNVLVFSPPGWQSQDVPLLPTFRICDVSRLLPLSENGTFRGTYEFGPPFAERRVKQTPCGDVYSIGASMQWFALGILPVMSNAEFIKMKKLEGGAIPSLHDLKHNEAWRAELPPEYRPLDASIDFQKHNMKLERPVPPCSHELNKWYDKIIDVKLEKRISSRLLAKKVRSAGGYPYRDGDSEALL
ncbi:uncharacterized protein N0V89_004357 [Didymosphaeria variabile]|uniref:Protein kinase domain-containing protein n=1 Tax=Didymosphaeria variabile TaxID=1932322 RepID=A0A9W8XPA4_9PLEO|nr:uncharacterized protein N0V89_004357 [Didymosphaeria variabile]KAJ4356325.1 hypothetical protein N0V89_004357 [Didymosphaeria variabile]